MGTIAKGEITLSPVNDAYTVLLTPSSCSISADFDGSNPALGNAKGTISVKRGTKSVPFKVDSTSTSSQDIQVNLTTQETNIVSFAIIKIPNTILEGHVKFHIITLDGFNYSTEVQFSFNIVRESTMLDWIQDWEGSKTKIGGTYIMTPKLFVGKKEAVLDTSGVEPTWKQGALTGVYIGPDLLASGEGSVGIYGYLKDKQVFHINADGGFIGGWMFNDAGLQSSNGIVNILSEGSIYAQNPDSETPYWGLYVDGHATFANGNVKFMKDGSAEFSGTIKSPNGIIGGWGISKHQLHANRIVLDSYRGVIGIDANSIILGDQETGDYVFPENPDGGVKMWYNSAADFGFAGWSAKNKVFQIGSTNMIAGWNFNHEAIWFGTGIPALTQGSYTSKPNAITIATSGIRSNKWFIDANGSASFVGGSVKFNAENAEMFGWLMRSGRFSSKHTALVSDNSNAGVYVSVADISEVSGLNLRNTISQNGGIYLYSDGVNSIMRAYDTAGNVGFSLRTTGYNTIASWAFDSNIIYIGSNKLSQDGFTLTEGSMALASSGIFGYKWKFLADGSGALAGGKINWDKNGNITVDAKISANNITTGTISTASIKCEGKWNLDIDGSGYLANQNVIWDSDGNINVKGSFSQDMHYAYKSDATVIARRPTGKEDEIELKLNHHIYIATNVIDFIDYDLYISGNWPYPLYHFQYYIIRLPLDRKFIGKEIKIYDCNYGPFTRQPMGWCTTTIKVEDDENFITKFSYPDTFTPSNEWKSITIRGGYASFVCIPNNTSTKKCKWICVDFYGALCEGVDAKNNSHTDLLSCVET